MGILDKILRALRGEAPREETKKKRRKKVKRRKRQRPQERGEELGIEVVSGGIEEGAEEGISLLRIGTYPRSRPTMVVMMSYKGGVGKSTLAVTLAQLFSVATGFRAGLIDLDFANRTASILLLSKTREWSKLSSMVTARRYHSIACAVYAYVVRNLGSVPSFDPIVLSIPATKRMSGENAPRCEVAVYPSATEPDFRTCVVNGLSRYSDIARDIAVSLPDVCRVLAFSLARERGCRTIFVDLPPLRPETPTRSVYDIERVVERVCTMEDPNTDIVVVIVAPPQPSGLRSTLELAESVVPRNRLAAIVVSGADSHVFEMILSKIDKDYWPYAVRVPYNDKWSKVFSSQVPIIPYADDPLAPSPSLIAAATILCKARLLDERACIAVFDEARKLKLVPD